MTTSIDLVILVGPSNAMLVGTIPLTGEVINGVSVNGTALTLACREASEALGLGSSGVVSEFKAGSDQYKNISPGTAFAGSDLTPGNPGNSDPVWFQFKNNDPQQGIQGSTLESEMNVELNNT